MNTPTTANEWAQFYFQEVLAKGQDRVTNVSVHDYVGNKTGQSNEVLNGTLDGVGPGSLNASPWYTDFWYPKKLDSGRIIHCRKTAETLEVENTEDSEATFDQKLAYEKIMGFLPAEGSTRLLTMSANSFGSEAAIAQNAGVQLEDLSSVASLQARVNDAGFQDSHYDMLNVEVPGFACQKMFNYVSVINRKQNADVVALTMQCLDAFRTTGPFQDALRAKYAGQPDPHARCIADWMENYEMVERFTFRKSSKSRRMEV